MKIVIIKIGATGDVVRTTVLLHLYRHDEITWITARINMAVLPVNQPNLVKVLAIEDIKSPADIAEQFDFVISLDDDLACARLVDALTSQQIFGARIQENSVVYTDDAREWFDMGLSSRLGKQRADELKWLNTASYQTILFRMLGHSFTNEEYIIREDVVHMGGGVIGIEARAGARWPTKVWNQYDQLAVELRVQGYDVLFFEDRPTITEYMQDFCNVGLFIGGDTLGMHIALALKIPLVSLFTCTSAVEIHGYDRMEKVISPFLREAFYKTEYVAHAVDSVELVTVLQATHHLLSR